MPDNINIRQPQDPRTVNTSQVWEVDYWCKKFGCTSEQLKKAVDAVGTSASHVEKYLKGGR